MTAERDFRFRITRSVHGALCVLGLGLLAGCPESGDGTFGNGSTAEDDFDDDDRVDDDDEDGASWRGRLVLEPDSSVLALEFDRDVQPMGSRGFRAESFAQVGVDVFDTSFEPRERVQPLGIRGEDCALDADGTVVFFRPTAGEAECTAELPRLSTLAFAGVGVELEVRVGNPESPAQILDCEIDEVVRCVDRDTADVVPHPVVFPSPVLVTLRSDSPVRFGEDCETSDPNQSSLQVEGRSLCQVAPNITVNDGSADVFFPAAGGSVEIRDASDGRLAETCAFVEPSSGAGCELTELPRVMELRAVADDPYTRFVGFETPMSGTDGVNRIGCEATTDDRFEVDLARLRPGTPPGKMTIVCDATFECTEEAQMQMVRLALRGEAEELVLDYDVASGDSELCPIQRDGLWRCSRQIAQSEVPRNPRVELEATSRGAAALPTDYIPWGARQSVPLGDPLPDDQRGLQVEIDHCGTRYLITLEFLPD